MIDNIICYGVLLFSTVLLITDVIVAVTSDIRNAGKFIHRLRYWVYSITPTMYVIMILLVAVIFRCSDIDGLLIIVSLLAVGCCTAYAEKFFTRKKVKKSDQRRIRADERNFCEKSEYAEKLTPLTEKKG
ncbi:MAG: hypothetical protein J6B74_02970 [Ruminococcus sp.]|nr:hypothetical protein [Ruminococcus sp.]